MPCSSATSRDHDCIRAWGLCGPSVTCMDEVFGSHRVITASIKPVFDTYTTSPTIAELGWHLDAYG